MINNITEAGCSRLGQVDRKREMDEGGARKNRREKGRGGEGTGKRECGERRERARANEKKIDSESWGN